MKIKTISDRAHHFDKVNEKIEEFISRPDVVVKDLKPYVTDSRYMIVVVYEEKKPAKKVTKKS